MAKAAAIYGLAQAIGGDGFFAILNLGEIRRTFLPSAPRRSESLLLNLNSCEPVSQSMTLSG